MSENLNLQLWLERVRGAESREKVMKILDEFRTLPWTDQQRSEMSHFYMRTLDLLPQASASPAQAAKTANENDGPVWYEKM
jgi:hypothetical protein